MSDCETHKKCISQDMKEIRRSVMASNRGNGKASLVGDEKKMKSLSGSGNCEHAAIMMDYGNLMWWNQ